MPLHFISISITEGCPSAGADSQGILHQNTKTHKSPIYKLTTTNLKNPSTKELQKTMNMSKNKLDVF